MYTTKRPNETLASIAQALGNRVEDIIALNTEQLQSITHTIEPTTPLPRGCISKCGSINLCNRNLYFVSKVRYMVLALQFCSARLNTIRAVHMLFFRGMLVMFGLAIICSYVSCIFRCLLGTDVICENPFNPTPEDDGFTDRIDVRQLIVSENGTHVALVGPTHVSVVHLPEDRGAR